jgi:hypothetical protein
MYTSVTSAEGTKGWYQMEIYSNLCLVQNRRSVYLEVCNRHQGTVPQKDFFPMPTANHPMSLNFYIIEENKKKKKLYEPSLNIY